MRKTCSAIVACLLLISVSAPVWANSGGHGYNHSYYHKFWERLHKIIINHQFQSLKHMYQKSHPDARDLFLEYLGTAVPSADEQIQALREEYEAQIAQLNESIASYQQQLENVTAQMNAACDARLAQAQADCSASTQAQLNDLAAAHQTEIAQLTTQMNKACDDRLAQAYLEWQASGGNCQPGPPEKVNVVDTTGVDPYAIDVDTAGNMYVLDQDNRTITIYDPAGTRLTQWDPGTLTLPVDIAVDSQGAVYVLDQAAEVPLQKFGPGCTPMPFSPSTPISYPMGLFIDNQDTIYVTNLGGVPGGRILNFDTSGNLLRSFGNVPDLEYEDFNDIIVDELHQAIYVVTGYLVAKFDLNGTYVESWYGDFRTPHGIAVAPGGDVIVADTYNNIIDVYKNDGSFSYSFANDLYRPYRIVTDSTGRLYVADYRNMQIKIYE